MGPRPPGAHAFIGHTVRAGHCAEQGPSVTSNRPRWPPVASPASRTLPAQERHLTQNLGVGEKEEAIWGWIIGGLQS